MLPYVPVGVPTGQSCRGPIPSCSPCIVVSYGRRVGVGAAGAAGGGGTCLYSRSWGKGTSGAKASPFLGVCVNFNMTITAPQLRGLTPPTPHPSPVNDLLERGNYTLAEILDEDDLLQVSLPPSQPSHPLLSISSVLARMGGVGACALTTVSIMAGDQGHEHAPNRLVSALLA
jgi:hypothetical protein